ncbi:MAG TPA: MerR family transcriptional regulator [Acidobacteriaceae bacterium]|nr:MerR family transcriptional regulator [Acidobacteriaceae bacterium]
MYRIPFHRIVPSAAGVAYTCGYQAQILVDEGPHLRRHQVRMIKHTSQKKNKAAAPNSYVSVAGTPIPDKLYFRIGDVAKLCGVEAYVLRFWETEFPQLKPNKSGTGQRLYRRRDVELALRIKQLLYADGYTIAGARQVFTAESREARKAPPPEPQLKSAAEQVSAEKQLLNLRAELKEIHGLLSQPVKTGLVLEKPAPVKHPRRPNEPGLFDV